MRKPAKSIVLFTSAAAKCGLNNEYMCAVGNTHTEAPEKLGQIIGIRCAKLEFNNKEEDSANHEDLTKYKHRAYRKKTHTDFMFNITSS